ncbi:glycogen debranching protein GlgX [Bifidobacterium bifidum]|uniref:glycogen debranching protein GlgX n=1 Tax=Bifidobacterium bifidum TaxID=1681 RepID=UPI000641AAEF|nr:glycogen debranching protein GlgX [Bifidobacterium bifidum]KLN79374.1 glycogen operon protein glgX [Bifidobacterium bifidum]MDB1250463.1 glycogen debranching protein GlgX [Bifidobacterium bifidum]MDB1252242.1 glycogen debranching protein GlgX [Bifidobacterium bifidum]
MKHAIPQRYAIPHRYATRPGLYFTEDGGADVIVRSETADQVWLCIYEKVDQPTAFFNDAIRIFDDSATPFINEIHEHAVCTRIIEPMYVRETLFRMDGPNYGLWYVHLPKAWDGMRYAYRVDGAWDPSKGLRFNPYKLLLDPYGKGIDGRMKLSPAAFSYQCDVSEDGKVRGSAFGPMSTVDALGNMPVSVAIDDRDKTKHDADPSHPHVPWSKTVLYELHVKGFTANAPWLPKELRGTYAGLAHPTTLSYLQSLGVTSIELLPIQAKQDELFLQERGRHNYWGYSPLSYFSPEPSYATAEAQRKGARAIRDEVIGMVRALHEAGFEVIMDVVYNHTCEGGVEGPTTCWRGLDALLYYRRQKGNIGRLEDTTGCGNTFDFTNTHVVTFAVDSLRYWAKRIGIDGFRFDLGVSLARLDGDFTKHHPFLYALRSDLLLGNLKLIMEPWDLGPQGWRTGGFGMPFSEWNDRFRDTVRRFWITDTQPGAPSGIGMQEMATRLCGSSDLFATEPGRGCVSSINYVSCHDGFTLTDLTRYAVKHNEANGENNIDGSNVNHSANFGVEGPSDDPAIIRKREQAAMNMLGTLMLSLGTPMMLAGDEFGNSQSGNNNAYAQDNDITWLNWDWIYQTRKTMQMHRLETVSRLLSIRKSLGLYHHEEFFTRLTQLGLFKPSSRVQWYLPDGTTPMDRDWFDTTIRSFAMRLLSQDEVDVLIVINGVDEVRRFTLPSDCSWQYDWSSATAVGLRPTPGDRLQRIGKNQALRSNWIMSVSEKDNIHQLLKTVQASLAEQDKLDLLGATTEHADVLFEDDEQTPGVGADVSATMSAASTVHGASASARDGGNATVNGSVVWTMPALSISVMRRLQ